ncbi:MAG: thymidine phosphorylase, partial [Synergistes sp.]|nr:thymidine phosphorylase [Synergistes sp.]
SAEDGRKKAERAIADGSALSKLEEIIASQGGEAKVVHQPLKILPRATKTYQLKETKGGVISRLYALSVGEALRALGGGRMKLGDKIDYSAAIRLNKKIGCAVKAGESVIDIFYNDDAKLKDALVLLEACWSTSSEAEKRSLIIETVG